MPLYGPDISHHQDDAKPINFDLLRGNVDFVISKITDGVNYVDPQGTRHVAETRRIGAIAGVYHFARNNDPNLEAGFFLAHAPNLEGAFVALDAETNQTPAWCLAWLTAVERRIGAAPLVYLNKSAIAGADWSPVINGGFGLWEADYDGNASDFSAAGEWPCLAIKQYSSHNSLPGVTGAVDADSFNGSIAQLRAYCVPVHNPAPIPSPGIRYVVATGDTLSLLAIRTWNDASLWPRIYAANRAIIGPNPNVLKPGTVLHIV